MLEQVRSDPADQPEPSIRRRVGPVVADECVEHDAQHWRPCGETFGDPDRQAVEEEIGGSRWYRCRRGARDLDRSRADLEMAREEVRYGKRFKTCRTGSFGVESDETSRRGDQQASGVTTPHRERDLRAQLLQTGLLKLLDGAELRNCQQRACPFRRARLQHRLRRRDCSFAAAHRTGGQLGRSFHEGRYRGKPSARLGAVG